MGNDKRVIASTARVGDVLPLSEFPEASGSFVRIKPLEGIQGAGSAVPASEDDLKPLPYNQRPLEYYPDREFTRVPEGWKRTK